MDKLVPGRPDRNLTPEQEAEVEDYAEKRGISIDMAERAILGIRVEDPGEDTVKETKKSKKRRSSRRGGRSYGEISGTEVSQAIARQDALDNPVDHIEQRTVNDRGIAMARRLLGKSEIDTIVRQEQARTDADPYDPEKARLRKCHNGSTDDTS